MVPQVTALILHSPPHHLGCSFLHLHLSRHHSRGRHSSTFLKSTNPCFQTKNEFSSLSLRYRVVCAFPAALIPVLLHLYVCACVHMCVRACVCSRSMPGSGIHGPCLLLLMAFLDRVTAQHISTPVVLKRTFQGLMGVPEVVLGGSLRSKLFCNNTKVLFVVFIFLFHENAAAFSRSYITCNFTTD